MPTRILREGILESEAVNALSESAELFYRRLMSVVDDYGRFHRNPTIIRSKCYPLRIDKLSDADVNQMLDECEASGLLAFYEHQDGKKYLHILNFGQQTRSKSRFPDPEMDECNKTPRLPIAYHLISNASQMCTQSESESESKTYAKAETGVISSSLSSNVPKSSGTCPGQKGDLFGFDKGSESPVLKSEVGTLPERLSTQRMIERWDNWMRIRRQGTKVKDWISLFNAQIDWLGSYSEAEAYEIIGASIRNGWTGLFPPKSGMKIEPQRKLSLSQGGGL